jgi:alkaline phosphatase D
VRNGVVLTGDVHSHWAAEVHERFDDPSSPAVATELVTTSISSGGDGSESRDEIAAVLPENPHIRYFNNRRGYVRTRITPDEMRADFRVLPYVSRPGGSGTHQCVVRCARPGTVAVRDVNRASVPRTWRRGARGRR